MAISKQDRNTVINALRALGGRTTLRKLAAAVGRDVNGLSQTLNGKTFKAFVGQESGNGGDRIVFLTEQGLSRGSLFDHIPR